MRGLQPLFNLTPDGKDPIVIAGPCSAESQKQTMDTARELKQIGVKIFRAGVWKPRTKPGGFEGMGLQALEWLKKVREETGMQVITEVATAMHLDAAIHAGLDGIWIGARTATNPFAVQDLADTLSKLPEQQKAKLTVLIKNPVNPDLDLWIGSIERVYKSGIRRIGVIHRGFSSYGRHIYRNQPRWAIPIELKRIIPELPIIFDPSHIAGRSELIGELVGKAASLDYAGYIIESHISPGQAMSDASQQITPAELAVVLASLQKKTSSGEHEALEILRGEIDNIDERLLELLSRRMEISRQIGEYKRKNGMPVIQFDRYKKLMERRVSDAEKLRLSPVFIREILASIHEESVKQQFE